jgi:hypothetical protein
MIVQSPNKKEIAAYQELKQDTRLAGGGYYMEVNLMMNSGVWTEVEGKRIWSICLSAPMKSDSVEQVITGFRNVHLVPDAKLYIYSPDGKFVEEVSDKHFSTPNMYGRTRSSLGSYMEKSGGTIIIQIIEPANSTETSNIEIYTFCYVPIALLPQDTSLPCEVDIACHPNNNFYILKTITA